MPHWRTLLDNTSSKYIGSWDLVGPDGVTPMPYVVEIVSVKSFSAEHGKPKSRKADIELRGWPKHFLCNVTNGDTIQGIYGGVEKWPGKLITIHNNPDVTFGRGKKAKKTGGISVLNEAPPAGARPTRPPMMRAPDSSADAKREAAQSSESLSTSESRESGED